ncbi:MAG: adenylyl-sulfate kinase [Thermodesulfobacteriota bacterium]
MTGTIKPQKILDLAENLVRTNGHISRRNRNTLNRHPSGLLWFTGFSGAGKSTIAHGVEKELLKRSIRSYVLDGDNVRYGINADLGFSRQDRRENVRRIVEISKLFMDAGLIVLASFISPYREDREMVRNNFKVDNFYEIYVKCSIQECARRDPKGMYEKARQGLIENYTGISSPYEEPESPDLVIDTERVGIEDSILAVLDFMDRTGMLSWGEFD